MYRYTVIKVRLGGSHLDGHSEPLEHLVAAPAHHVETHHLLLQPGADQLHHRLRLPGGHGVIERRELGLVDLQILLAKLLRGFLLSETNCPDLKITIVINYNGQVRSGQVRSGQTYRGVGEDHGGYVAVVQLQVWFVIKQSVGQAASCSDGHGSQERLAGHIPEGVEAGYVGVLELVHQDVAGLVQVEADVCTAETVSVGKAAHGPEEDVSGRQGLSSVETDHQPLTGLVYSGYTNTSLDIDPASLHLPRHGLADLLTRSVSTQYRALLCLPSDQSS